MSNYTLTVFGGQVVNFRITSPLMVRLLPLSTLSGADLDTLVQILNCDSALNACLGGPSKRTITRAGFIQQSSDWQKTRNATTYCIYTDRPVGTISLSNRRPDGTARIGYWLANSAWGKRIATEAFRQVVEIACREGIRQVSATIERQNIASLRIWRRLGAVEQGFDPAHLRMVLELTLDGEPQ